MRYELTPTNGRKSFYRKAMVDELENGDKVLYSYDTMICTLKPTGEVIRHYFGTKTNTTCCHVKSFLGERRYAGFWNMKEVNHENV